jgi:hypothetical protein
MMFDLLGRLPELKKEEEVIEMKSLAFLKPRALRFLSTVSSI